MMMRGGRGKKIRIKANRCTVLGYLQKEEEKLGASPIYQISKKGRASRQRPGIRDRPGEVSKGGKKKERPGQGTDWEEGKKKVLAR